MPAAVRVLAVVVGGLALVMGLAWAAIYVVSESRLQQKLVVPTESIPISTDISSVQRGQHMASAVAVCMDCHGPYLAGKVLMDDPALGRFVPPNLTRGRGGVGATFSDQDLVRAIRHGVDPSGRQLLIMPSDNYNRFSDTDLGAIVAYVRSLPAIDTALPTNEIRAIGRILFVVGQLQLLPAANIARGAPRPAPPQTGVNAAYGEYLANAAGCASCHGPGLAGGRTPQPVFTARPSANITPAELGKWSEADFLKVMRTGTRPDGRRLDPSMPWPYFAQMTDDELRAIWRFLQTAQ
jgi:mono/diheme cytochrome c family protein